VPDEVTRLTPLVPILSYPGLLLPIDIGIIPLNNIQFNHAKSFIKGLEYAAAGVPFVASALPEYELLASQGIGRIARTDAEWEANLTDLLDYRLRRDEMIVNREVLEQFSMSARAPEWETTMREILEMEM
jgi:hypothetical protein